MLIRLFFSSLLMFFVTVVNSQHTTYEPTFLSTDREIEKKFALATCNDLEFRFWTKNILTRKVQLLILIKIKNKWEARFFEKTIMGADTLVEILIGQNNLNHLWKKLEKQNVLSIPDASLLKDKEGKEYNASIHDGLEYQFEMRTKNEKRMFSYHCPKMYSKKFKKVKEFKQVTKLINLIKVHFKLKIYAC